MTRRFAIDVLDELAADAGAPRLRGDEQVLEVAIVAYGPAGSMPDEMHQADRTVGRPHQRSRRRLIGIDEPRPGDARHVLGDVDTVERLIAAPQRLPGRAIPGADRADFMSCIHGDSFQCRGATVAEPKTKQAGA